MASPLFIVPVIDPEPIAIIAYSNSLETNATRTPKIIVKTTVLILLFFLVFLIGSNVGFGSKDFNIEYIT